jgi:hypothetical protein
MSRRVDGTPEVALSGEGGASGGSKFMGSSLFSGSS